MAEPFILLSLLVQQITYNLYHLASRHILALDFPETAVCGLFPIKDMSQYSTLLPVSCATLEVTPPGYTTPTVISVSSGFNNNFNSCQLGITFSGCGDSLPNLGDGIYHIRYSVSPNASVYVEYNVLRIVKIMRRYASVCCGLNLHKCAPSVEVDRSIMELELILSMVNTAKYLVEDCNKPDEGMDVLDYATSRLDKFSCSSC